MAFDAHVNFGYSLVATAPSPASSGTSLTVASGQGALFPAVPFNVTIWPTRVQPSLANAEIARVTNIVGDVFTITRAQESTAARAIQVNDQISATITAKTLTDIEATGTDAGLQFTDITTNNVSTSKHGFTPKAPNDTAKFLRGDATWAIAASNTICNGRLTLTSGSPITTADITGATNVYFTPYQGNRIALYDGTQWGVLTFSEITIPLGTITNDLPYDVFAYNNSGAVACEILAWSSKTARATALVTQDGILSKSGAVTRRYLGTFHTTATTTTEDSFAKRLLWNYYNRIQKSMRVAPTTDNWNYTTSTVRQANADTANQLAFVIGFAEVEVYAHIQAHARNASSVSVNVGIGEDTTTIFTPGGLFGAIEIGDNLYHQVDGTLRKYPAVGYHFWSWNETSGVGGTTNWFGDDNSPTLRQSGISGFLQG